MGRRGIKTTPEKKALFLAALRESPNISQAARTADVDRRTPYKWRDEDTGFAQDWDSALEEAVDTLEQEAHRRAFEGCTEPVGWHQGVAGGTVKRYSDTLAIFLLKAHRPERFRDNLHLSGEVDGADGELKAVSLSVLQKLEKLIDDEADGDGDEEPPT